MGDLWLTNICIYSQIIFIYHIHSIQTVGIRVLGILANVSIAQQAISKYSKIKTKLIFTDNYVDNNTTHKHVHTHSMCLCICLMPSQQDGSYGNRSC